MWLPHWNVSTQDPRGYWPFLLEQSGSLKSRTSFQGYDLSEYEMQSPLREPELKPASADGMITQRSDFDGQGADGALAFALTWQTPVKFFDASASFGAPDRCARKYLERARRGCFWTSEGRTTDHWESLEPVTNYYVLPIPPGTPPGTYTITAQLYNSRDLLANESVGAIELPRRLDTNDPYRTLDGYHWNNLANTSVVPGLTLEAYAVSPQSPGKPMPIDVTLRWRKTGDAYSLLRHV